jgi:hypothetical protein
LLKTSDSQLPLARPIQLLSGVYCATHNYDLNYVLGHYSCCLLLVFTTQKIDTIRFELQRTADRATLAHEPTLCRNDTQVRQQTDRPTDRYVCLIDSTTQRVIRHSVACTYRNGKI